MMNKTIQLFNTLLNQTNKKSEKKVYNCFIRTLSSLKYRDLSDDQLQLIQDKLTSLNLNEVTENKKKSYKRKLSKFKAFLKNEFSLIPANYYTEIYMIYGMIYGTGIGISTGTAIDPHIGISIGLSIGAGAGIVLGIVYGARKDAEAKRQGKVI